MLLLVSVLVSDTEVNLCIVDYRMDEPGLKFILGKPLRGWLRRQGGMMRGWQRKFFVLQENCLFCFSREDDTRVSHTYLLDDYQLKEITINTDDPDKFVFELISGTENYACFITTIKHVGWFFLLFCLMINMSISIINIYSACLIDRYSRVIEQCD